MNNRLIDIEQVGEKIDQVYELIQIMDDEQAGEVLFHEQNLPDYQNLYSMEQDKNRQLEKQLKDQSTRCQKIAIYLQKVLQVCNKLKETLTERDNTINTLLQKQKGFQIELTKTRVALEQERIKKDASQISNIQKKDKPDQSQDAEDDNLLRSVKVDDYSINQQPKRYKTEDSLLLSLQDEDVGNYRLLQPFHDSEAGGIAVNINLLQQEVQELRASNQMYIGQIEQLQRERDKMETLMLQQASQHTNYQQMLSANLNQQMAELEYRCLEYQKQVRRLQTQIKMDHVRMAKLQRYELEVVERKAQIQSLKHKLRLNQTTSPSQEPANLQAIQHMLASQTSINAKLEAENNKLKASLETSQNSKSHQKLKIKDKLHKILKLVKQSKIWCKDSITLIVAQKNKNQKQFKTWGQDAGSQIKKIATKVTEHLGIIEDIKQKIASKNTVIESLEQQLNMAKTNKVSQKQSDLQKRVADTLEIFSQMYKTNSVILETKQSEETHQRIIHTLVECIQQLIWHSQTLPTSTLSLLRDLRQSDKLVQIQVKAQLLLQRTRQSQFYEKTVKNYIPAALNVGKSQ